MSNKKSFTLLELLVAIAILTFAVIAILGLMVFHFQVSQANQNQLIAAYLAQEGVEIINNIRNENYLKGQNWTQNISQGTFNNIDYKSHAFPDPNISTSSCNNLLYSSSDGYQCRTGTATIFSRQVSVSVSQDPQDQMLVTSTVFWTERGVQKKFEVVSKLFNWGK